MNAALLGVQSSAAHHVSMLAQSCKTEVIGYALVLCDFAARSHALVVRVATVRDLRCTSWTCAQYQRSLPTAEMAALCRAIVDAKATAVVLTHHTVMVPS